MYVLAIVMKIICNGKLCENPSSSEDICEKLCMTMIILLVVTNDNVKVA